MAINLRAQHPMQLVHRLICIQGIKEIGAENIYKLDKKFWCFINIFDDGGEPEIDWEFCIFGATEHQFNTLFENFLPKEKEELPKSRIITEDKPPITDSPGLIV